MSSSQYPDSRTSENADSGTSGSPSVTSPLPPSTSQETKTHQTLPKQDKSAEEEDSSGDTQNKNKRKQDQSAQEEDPTGDIQKTNKRMRTDKQDQKSQEEENAGQEQSNDSVEEEKMPQKENPNPIQENPNPIQENPTGAVEEKSDGSVPEEKMPQQENPIELNPNQENPAGGEAQNAVQEQSDDSIPEERMPQQENPIEENPNQENSEQETQEEESVSGSEVDSTPSEEIEDSGDEEYVPGQKVILFPDGSQGGREILDDIMLLNWYLVFKSDNEDLPFSNFVPELTRNHMAPLLHHMRSYYDEAQYVTRARLRNKFSRLIDIYRLTLQVMGPNPAAQHFPTPQFKKRFDLMKMVFD